MTRPEAITNPQESTVPAPVNGRQAEEPELVNEPEPTPSLADEVDALREQIAQQNRHILALHNLLDQTIDQLNEVNKWVRREEWRPDLTHLLDVTQLVRRRVPEVGGNSDAG